MDKTDIPANAVRPCTSAAHDLAVKACLDMVAAYPKGFHRPVALNGALNLARSALRLLEGGGK